MTRRVERAAAMLRFGDLGVTDVCMAVGCTSLGSFSSRFTELMGMTPTEFRAQAHEGARVIPTCVAKQVDRPVRKRSGSEKREEGARAHHG